MAEMNGVAPFGVSKLQAWLGSSGIRMGTQRGGGGWRGGTWWVTGKGGFHLEGNRLLLLSWHVTSFTGYLPGRVAGKHQCWATTCCPMAWTGGSSNLCVLLELLSAGKVIFLQGFLVLLFRWYSKCFTSFPTQLSWGKNQLYLPVLGAKISSIPVYRGINLTKLANFRFHDERETEVCRVSTCSRKGCVFGGVMFPMWYKWD